MRARAQGFGALAGVAAATRVVRWVMRERAEPSRSHRPFAVVLGGGGARGFAHLGVLRGLSQLGYAPSLVVGVSMGAVVGVTYASRDDWYEAVLAMPLADFPGPTASVAASRASAVARLRTISNGLRVLAAMVLDWGPASPARVTGMAALRNLVGHEPLDHRRIPVLVTATDLRSGQRVVLRDAPADDAVYASAALAGVLPPLVLGDWLLSDGAYADLAPVDLARELPGAAVLAVDAGGPEHAGEIRNGYSALLRAMDVCHRRHAHLRFAEADLVLRPRFARAIETMEFSARRECVVAGIRVVREHRTEIAALLSGDIT